MTIASTVNKSGPYTCNGVTTDFPGEFKISDETHVKVVHADASGAETVLDLNSGDYTVSGVGGDDFNVSIVPALASGKVTLVLNVPLTQNIDFENQGEFFAETVEEALDLGVQRALQLQEQVDRAIKVTVSSTADPETLVTELFAAKDTAVSAASSASGSAAAASAAAEAAATFDPSSYIPKSLLTTRGDIIVRDAAGPARKGVGGADTFLGSDGTDPGWKTAAQVRSSIGIDGKVLAKTAAYTVAAADRGKAIVATSGTWTLSLPAAATVGDGFGFWLRNASSGVITIDPNGSELVNGGTTQAVYPGDGGYVFCDATGWHVVGLRILAASFGTSGWVRYAGGEIRQWVDALADGGVASYDTWTFPIAFLSACQNVLAILKGTPGDTSIVAAASNLWSTTSCRVYRRYSNGGVGLAGQGATIQAMGI